MQAIKLPFGTRVFDLEGHMTIYTCKLRIKCSLEQVEELMSIMRVSISRRGYIMISYVTTDVNVHMNNQQAIKHVLATIMHKRIDEKYFGDVCANAMLVDELQF